MKLFKPYLWRQDDHQRMMDADGNKKYIEIDDVRYYLPDAIISYIDELEDLLWEYREAMDGR